MVRHVVFRNLPPYLIALAIVSVAAVRAQEPEHAQKLPESRYTVCGRSLSLEIADTGETRQIGLMHRTGIPKGRGMLFSFAHPQTLEFWMHNVPFDIDIGYFDAKGQLATSMTMKGTTPLQKPDTLPRYSSEKEVVYAVEVPKGFFKESSTKHCALKPLPKLGQ